MVFRHMFSTAVRFMAVLLLALASRGPSCAADGAAGQKVEFRRVEAKKAEDYAPLHSSWGVVRNLDEAIEACLDTGFIEDARVVRAGDGKVLTVEPDGTEVTIEIIGGSEDGGGSATPVGAAVQDERRGRVAGLVGKLGLKLPAQTLILLPPGEGFRVHELRLLPPMKDPKNPTNVIPHRLVVDVRPSADQPADEVVIVPRAIPADALVVFVDGADNDRELATIGGDVGAGPRLAPGG